MTKQKVLRNYYLLTIQKKKSLNHMIINKKLQRMKMTITKHCRRFVGRTERKTAKQNYKI